MLWKLCSESDTARQSGRKNTNLALLFDSGTHNLYIVYNLSKVNCNINFEQSWVEPTIILGHTEDFGTVVP